jgi:hypothetical protein
MTEMVREMLGTGVIESVDAPRTLFCTSEPGLPFWRVLPAIYSTYFLIPKGDGSFRGCLDCRFYNQFVKAQSFRMDSLRVLRSLAQPGDWMVKLDLASAYLVCGIHPHARPAFRFVDPVSGRRYLFGSIYSPKTRHYGRSGGPP